MGRAFADHMHGDETSLPAELDGLRPLEAVKQHRSRINCTLLAWQALGEAAPLVEK